jgi:hypothetical protein
MQTKQIYPTTPVPSSDWADVADLQRKLVETVDALNAMSADVGMAKHVLEYDGDRRKRALARAMAPALLGGDSGVKAEAEGRASETYQKEMQQLGKEHQAAEQQVAAWEATKIQWETARSLLAMQRDGLKRL